MTALLASVTDINEASQALAGGANLIDLKDPTRGALGALPADRIEAVRSHVDRRVPVSATVGDLSPDPVALAAAIERTAATGVDLVKIGFDPATDSNDCLDRLADTCHRHRLIAVLFADRPGRLEPAGFAAAGFAGVMLDTAGKARGSLLAHRPVAEIERFLQRARGLGLLTGLAGSLGLADIDVLAPLAPDYLGFRGALCRARQRQAALDPERLATVRGALDRHRRYARVAQTVPLVSAR